MNPPQHAAMGERQAAAARHTRFIRSRILACEPLQLVPADAEGSQLSQHVAAFPNGWGGNASNGELGAFREVFPLYKWHYIINLINLLMINLPSRIVLVNSRLRRWIPFKFNDFQTFFAVSA